jgi:sodium-dependent phosphate cotransporter
VSSPVESVTERLPEVVGPALRGLATVLLFLFAVQLLGTATDAAAPTLRRLLRRVVVGDAPALGLGWLGAYALANGSVVAAVGLSLFATGALTTTQLFLVVAGSRLGGAAVVVFVGAIDHVQGGHDSVRRSISVGLLAFLLTHSVYLPVTAVGYAGLPALLGPAAGADRGGTVLARSPSPFEPVAGAITTGIGPGPTVLLAVALLFASLRLFDRLLSGVDTAVLRGWLSDRFRRVPLAFAAGLLLTGLTTSVAFSLGMVVPLYNRGHVERATLVPYVLGANIGTLFDTLLVAVVLESGRGTAVVLAALGVATLLTLVALAVHGSYSRAVLAAHDRLLSDRAVFLVFVAALVVVPLALVVVPLALASP